MFIPCIARLRIKNQHCALGIINLFVDMRILHVSASYFMFNNFLYENRDIYEIILKIMADPDKSTGDDIMGCMRIA
jgi:hypothetical protein